LRRQQSNNTGTSLCLSTLYIKKGNKALKKKAILTLLKKGCAIKLCAYYNTFGSGTSSGIKEEFLTNEVLQDYDQFGREIEHGKHRAESEEIAWSFKRNGDYKTANKIYYCGEVLNFGECVDCGGKVLRRANFCKNPLCVMCAARRAKIIQKQEYSVINSLVEEGRYRFITLVLTQPRFAPEDLGVGLERSSAALATFFDYPRIKRAFLGTVRALETPYDPEEFITKDMWYGNKARHMKPRAHYYKKLGLNIGDPNPSYDTFSIHYHFIIAVDAKNYFGTENYLTQKEISDLWAKALGIERAVTWVKVVKKWVSSTRPEYIKEPDGGRVKTTTLNAAIKECIKYVFKPSTFINKDKAKQDRCVDILSKVLKGKHKVVHTGVMLSRKLELYGKKDVQDEDADLIGKKDDKSEVCRKCGGRLEEVVYKWHRQLKAYVRVDLDKLYNRVSWTVYGVNVDYIGVQRE
jgi:plasmid rolling circle replication initiator protein Rep